MGYVEIGSNSSSFSDLRPFWPIAASTSDMDLFLPSMLFNAEHHRNTSEGNPRGFAINNMGFEECKPTCSQ
jgi:hypothetical protein